IVKVEEEEKEAIKMEEEEEQETAVEEKDKDKDEAPDSLPDADKHSKEAANTKLLQRPTPQMHLTANLNPSAKEVNNAALRLNNIVLIINEGRD
ncbi:hypothetical protein A2U01_0016928, partial [Trifolium medium]|nr:hypothetical protein [Trifolium medium]